jgi:hypothetical protein
MALGRFLVLLPANLVECRPWAILCRLKRSGRNPTRPGVTHRAMNAWVLCRASTPREEAGTGTTAIAVGDTIRIGNKAPAFESLVGANLRDDGTVVRKGQTTSPAARRLLRDRRQVKRGDGNQAARPAGNVRPGRAWSRAHVAISRQSQGRELQAPDGDLPTTPCCVRRTGKGGRLRQVVIADRLPPVGSDELALYVMLTVVLEATKVRSMN